MNIWDILILLAVAAMVFFALRAIRGGKAGSCHKGGSCDKCAMGCGQCEKMKKKNEE